jgi:hypothetical protein
MMVVVCDAKKGEEIASPPEHRNRQIGGCLQDRPRVSLKLDFLKQKSWEVGDT